MIRTLLVVAVYGSLALAWLLGGSDGVGLLSGNPVGGSAPAAVLYVGAWLLAWTVGPIAALSLALEWAIPRRDSDRAR